MTTPSFDRPWLLGIGVLAAAVPLLLGARRPAGLAPWRRRGAVLLRAAGILAALAAAAGPHSLEATERRHQDLLARAGFPTGEGEGTVPRAVAAALARRDPEADARLVVTVGEPRGDEASAAASLREARAAGLPVLVRAEAPSPVPTRPDPPPPWLRGIRLPPGAVAGVPFSLEPDLAPGALEDAGAVAGLSVDGRVLGTWSPRSGRVPSAALSAGPHVVALDVRDGRGASRGAAAATVVVPGSPSILVVEEGEAPSAFVRALQAQGIPVARSAPGARAGLDAASVVVLGAGARGDAALEAAVRNGKGLLVLGAAPDSRGLGRLRGSPVERALPVFLAPPLPEPPPTLPPPEEKPPPPGKGPEVREEEGERPGAVVTLILVLDTSGSMWGVKLEMARRAAAAAAATLSPRDRFGLIAFSGEFRWEIAPGPAGDARRIGDALAGLHADGETHLLPALQEARRALRLENTAVRHCLLLTDGIASPFGLRQVIDGMVSEGATVSTVGVGEDYDARLLGNLAVWGKGRTFPAVDPASLPQVVTLDTRRIAEAGREAARKGRPAPDLAPPPSGKERPGPEPDRRPDPPEPPARVPVETADPCAALEGLGPWPAAEPPASTPEARLATTLALRFAGGRGPALVLGRHGLGRTAVLSLDPGEWADWEGFAPAMARLARTLAPAAPGPSVALDSVRRGATGTRVRFEVRGEGTAPIPRVEALHPRGDSPAAVPVERSGARSFEVLLPPAEAGFRTLVVRTGGPEDAGVPLGLFDPGPPPPSPPDPQAPRRLAAAAGVPFVEGAPPSPPPAGPGPPRRVPREIPFAVAAILLLVADTGLRRFRR